MYLNLFEFNLESKLNISNVVHLNLFESPNKYIFIYKLNEYINKYQSHCN